MAKKKNKKKAMPRRKIYKRGLNVETLLESRSAGFIIIIAILLMLYLLISLVFNPPKPPDIPPL